MTAPAAPPLSLPPDTPQPPQAPAGQDLSHDWVIAAVVPVNAAAARLADMRRYHRLNEPTQIRAIDVYCHLCRRTYEDAADQPCQARVNNEHLIGGDQRTRAKRRPIVIPEGAEQLPGEPIDRRGVRAVVEGP
ncbi:MAG TPA: hypothetical protein VFP72_02990 [Kineosporiaceae bacterium]|nr:hypothetical protein [Kineosporiaceae bacterium]